MKKIRVLRLLEYTYDTVEQMEADMSRWTLKTPTSNKSGMTMKSATLPLEVMDVYEDQKGAFDAAPTS